MRKSSRTGAITAAAILAAAAVGIASPASADPTAKPVQCPNYAAKTSGELDYVHQHGALIDQYVTTEPYRISHSVYRIDNHFEEFATDGARLGRTCFDKQPERKHDHGAAEWEWIAGNGGRGGSSVGHYSHAPSPYHLAGVTTKWVKWKVAVN